MNAGAEFSVKGADELIAKLGNRGKAVLSGMRTALRRGMDNYHRSFVENQLSGRKTESYGLNRRTGNAVKHTRVYENRTAGADYAVILGVGKEAWYLKIHQHYDFEGEIKNAFGKGIKVYIPKRLYLFEEWKSKGMPDTQKMVARAMNEALKSKM